MIYSSDPFEHWVIDDFLPTDMAQAARDHFYEGTGEWIRRHHLYSRHKRTRTQGLGEYVEAALAALECPDMLAYISALTKVSGLHADPLRFGGGQHVTTQGGKLGIHADFLQHPVTKMRRALNLLLYLDEGQGGELELWDAQMHECRVKVFPSFNKAVIFKTSITSFHGHPEPLAASERKSLAVYYYVAEALSDSLSKTTDYRPRPQDYRLRLRRWVKGLVYGR